MDTLTTNNCSKSSSKSSSNSNSSMDLGEKQLKQPKRGSRGQKLSRSRSLLQLLSRHLGRHFQHHHHHQQNDTVYSSQDDIRSSSTDSFSLSGSRNECLEVLNGGSSLDLENTSRTSSASYSPGLEFYDNNTHIYVETVYRPGSAMEQLHPHHYDDSSSSGADDDENEHEDEHEQQHQQHQQQRQREHVDENENLDQLKPQPRSASSASTGNKAGLHLSRISISSSVSRMLQHFSTSAATTATASLRSLSCSSTPLRQRDVSSLMRAKKLLTSSNSRNSSSNSSSSSSNSAKKSAKKDKKQQSILRPPVQYVYMKGMSGLYSRVPSYAACCPYTLHHMY
ncbi:rho GTPase-activating protein gacF [Drosophila hydei]|uniref:Rho GTPase-activating protein gacF n=1 Tax=Drosophila hydei TaxID=7224 RepID=A0A6J1MD60_DROHY|nr:rho GTPase-activating protein gacF [Drosophila hydei]